MTFLTVDRLLSIFFYIVKKLNDLADHHQEIADNIQKDIDELSAAKKVALDESTRVTKIADNINSLVNH